ncbi:MAG: hypothetical protein AAGG06_15530 [Pseudomonadota bacterium]
MIRIGAAILTLTLAGCGSVELLGTYRVPESPEVAEAPWPRLIDTPAPLAEDEFTADAPDPAAASALQADLDGLAPSAAARRNAVAAPVVDEATRRRLERAR